MRTVYKRAIEGSVRKDISSGRRRTPSFRGARDQGDTSAAARDEPCQTTLMILSEIADKNNCIKGPILILF
jgi:hypothetical protein